MEKLKKIIKIIIEVILLIIIAFSLFMIIRWCIGSIKNKKMSKKVNNEIKIEEILDGKRELDFDYLYNINSDTVGYLTIDSLGINYPVVKTTDNDYYLSHSFDKSKNVGGWIFMDYRNISINDDKNTVIYGHNMKDGSMFGKLHNLKNSDVDTIYYYDKDGKHTYKIYSIYEIEEEEYYITTLFDCGNAYTEFQNKVKARSIKEYSYEPKYEDNTLTLSTCSNNNKRFVVHAYKVN